MTWITIAILASIVGAASMDVNRHFKQDGASLNFWRLFPQLAVLAPICFAATWPKEAYFYGVAMVGALSIVVIDTYLYNAASRHNGRVASMIAPTRAFFALLIGFVIAPATFIVLTENPLTGALMIGGFTMAFLGAVALRRNPLAWGSFKPMILLGVASGIVFTLRKTAIEADAAYIQTAQILFVQYVLSAVFLYILLKRTNIPFRTRFSKNLAVSAFLMAVTLLGTAYLLNVAIVLAPNAGYPLAIMLAMPLWLMLYHKIRGIPDNFSPYGAAVVAIGVMLMLVAAA